METIVLKAIMERYGSLASVFNGMQEDADTVLTNLADDVDYEYNEEEIAEMIRYVYDRS